MDLMRSKVKAAFTHVLCIVLVQGDNSLLKPVLSEEEVDDIFALSILTDKAIEYLQYKVPDNKKR
jgi:hypothetical protein